MPRAGTYFTPERKVGLNMSKRNAKLSEDTRKQLLATLEARFEGNPDRHKGVKWVHVRERLEADTNALAALEAMEATGGEPDVVAVDKKSGEVTFMDCSSESPAGRRSVCFDRKGWESRKEHRPANNAVDMAAEMGVEMLTEEDYRFLQTLGNFDAKTSSWVQTPKDVRALGGALFCDFRYGKVFTYHNGAQSYYAARGFRAKVSIG